MKSFCIMSKTERLTNCISTAVNNERLVLVFGWVNADNEPDFDPFTFLVELVLIHLMLLWFSFNSSKKSLLREKNLLRILKMINGYDVT